MTDIEKKALALVNEVARELGWGETEEIFAAGYTRNEALFRAIEQHEATKQELSDYKQKVSDVVKAYVYAINPHTSEDEWENLKALIIPAPKPDPLVEALNESGVILAGPVAKDLRAALDARGFEIREKNDDQ